jgi:hypothetical protein
MIEIIATEQVFSPLSHGKPIAIRYHYKDGTFADAPVSHKKNIDELPKVLQDTIEAFEKRLKE